MGQIASKLTNIVKKNKKGIFENSLFDKKADALDSDDDYQGEDDLTDFDMLYCKNDIKRQKMAIEIINTLKTHLRTLPRDEKAKLIVTKMLNKTLNDC